MDKMQVKEIKKYILDKDINLDEIRVFFDICFEDTSVALFNALYCLLKKYDQNRKKVDLLIDLLEEIVLEKDPIELKKLVGPIISLKNKINNFKVKQRILINEPMARINDIFLNIHNNFTSQLNNKNAKYLEYLIFVDKNIFMIEKFLGKCEKVLNCKNANGDDIFSLIVQNYILLDEEDLSEINYYFYIIMLFFKSKFGDDLIKNKSNYLKIIKNFNVEYKKHVIKLIKLFEPDFKVSLEEIEQCYDIKFSFPDIILEEANSFKIIDDNRVDFTNQKCITLDGKDSHCLDDALYIEKNQDGTYNLYIHITDIPSLVPYSSLTNEEARKRIEARYLRDRNILLYPDVISNNICSLLPNDYKNVISYIFKLDPNFCLIEDSFRVVRGKIKVTYKISYEEGDYRLGKMGDSEIDNILLNLSLFADMRRKANVGKECYRRYENITNLKLYHESIKVDFSNTANIVHESMILVNYMIAKYFEDMSLPYIYRKVDLPSDSFMKNVIEGIKKIDENMVIDEYFLTALKDSYIRGSYSTVPVYHEGLKLDCYSHSTSPARRYVDSFCQYIINDLLFEQNITDINLRTWEYISNDLVMYLNKKKEENEIFERQYNNLVCKKLIKERK